MALLRTEANLREVIKLWIWRTKERVSPPIRVGSKIQVGLSVSLLLSSLSRTHLVVVHHGLFKRAGLVFRVGEILLFVRVAFEHVFPNGFDSFDSFQPGDFIHRTIGQAHVTYLNALTCFFHDRFIAERTVEIFLQAVAGLNIVKYIDRYLPVHHAFAIAVIAVGLIDF